MGRPAPSASTRYPCCLWNPRRGTFAKYRSKADAAGYAGICTAANKDFDEQEACCEDKAQEVLILSYDQWIDVL